MKHYLWQTIWFTGIMLLSACGNGEIQTEQPATGAATASLQLIIIGGPGAGKGTQAEKLQTTFGLAHISTGEILRSEVKKGTELGNTVAEVMQHGGLVDDQIILNLIEQRLQLADTEKGFILDGFPRTLAQARGLAPILQKRGNSNIKVIQLQVSDEEMTRRLLSRGRADDTEETVQNRIQKYHSETSEAIDFYAGKGVLIRINGEQSIEKVAEDIEKALRIE